MIGNVWELCVDPVADPERPGRPGRRLVGGFFGDGPTYSRAGGRGWAAAGAPGQRHRVPRGPRPREPVGVPEHPGDDVALVPRGKAWLGGGGGRPGDREVEFQDDFYLGAYPVTQEEWEKVTGTNPALYSRHGVRKDAVKDIKDADLKLPRRGRLVRRRRVVPGQAERAGEGHRVGVPAADR